MYELCKVFGPNRTKTLDVKHFGPINCLSQSGDYVYYVFSMPYRTCYLYSK